MSDLPDATRTTADETLASAWVAEVHKHDDSDCPRCADLYTGCAAGLAMQRTQTADTLHELQTRIAELESQLAARGQP